jgi:hypothetical protein
MTNKPSFENGWRAGRDPIQRWLRIIASIVCLVVFAWLALDPSRRDWPTLTVRLPYLGRSDNPPPPTYQQYQTPFQPPADYTPERTDNVIVTGDEMPSEVNN